MGLLFSVGCSGFGGFVERCWGPCLIRVHDKDFLHVSVIREVQMNSAAANYMYMSSTCTSTNTSATPSFGFFAYCR